MKKFALSLAISAGLFILFGSILPARASAATVYVAGDTGIDTRSKDEAQNPNTPWKTIQKASDESQPGDIINVKGGITYSDTRECEEGMFSVVCLNLVNGLEEAPITFQAWPGTGIPIIDANNKDAGFFILTNYIKIDGFKVTNSTLPSGEYQPAAGILVNSSTGLIITNNIVYNNALSGIYAFRIFDSIIANNTVTSTQYGIAVYARGITVKNNIITNCDNALLYDYYAEVKGIPSGVSEGVFILDYNLLYNNESNYSGVNQGEHDILVDPKFVNPSEFNFNLQSNSPAINVGADLDVVTEDIVQVPRPQGGSFDIGAYEYYSLLVSLTPLSPDPTTKTKPTFAGTATTVSGVNIKSIYYSIDGGAWVSSGVKATDGVFNSSQEKFTITLPTALSTGNHTIRVKAEDTSLSMSNISQDSFVIRAYTVVNAASEPVTQNTPSPDEDTPDTVDPTPLMPSNIIHEEPPVLNNVQSNDGHLNIILLLCLSLVAAALVFFVLYTTKKKAKVSSSQ